MTSQQKAVTHDNVYYKAMQATFRSAALAMSFVVVAFGTLVRAGYLDNRHYHSDLLFSLLSLGLLATGIWQFFFAKRSRLREVISFVLIHVFGVLILLFVAGMTSPFIIAYLLLLVAMDAHYGLRGLFLSCAVLGVGVFLHYVLYMPSDQDILTIITMGIFLISAALMISKIRSIADQERLALFRVREQENFQRERLLALINSMGDAVLTTDRKGVIRIYNATTLSLLDTNENLTGKPIDSVLELKDGANKPVSLVKETKSHHKVIRRTDLHYTFEDGDVMKLYVNIAPIRPGYRSRGESGMIIIIRDITKEKSLEEERDEFISVVSHELRTPIAISEGTLSNVKLLLERGTSPEKMVESVDTAHEQIIYLAKMINDLSTLSRAERGVADAPERIDTTDMLQNMYNEYAPQAQAKGLQFDLDLAPNLPAVNASRLYLEEILQNLITNAIKYTKKGSVTLRVQPNKHGDVIFAVKDTGIGMSKSDQKHIFEKFFRSEDYRTRETGGTGLGLYVVKKLSDKLNTQIEFKTRLNHGSVFGFTLRNQSAAVPDSTHSAPSSSPR